MAFDEGNGADHTSDERAKRASHASQEESAEDRREKHRGFFSLAG